MDWVSIKSMLLNVNSRLHIGYNVGKGYVTAENEVSKLIGNICENDRIHWRLTRASEKNRLIVIKEMGEKLAMQ